MFWIDVNSFISLHVQCAHCASKTVATGYLRPWIAKKWWHISEEPAISLALFIFSSVCVSIFLFSHLSWDVVATLCNKNCYVKWLKMTLWMDEARIKNRYQLKNRWERTWPRHTFAKAYLFVFAKSLHLHLWFDKITECLLNLNRFFICAAFLCSSSIQLPLNLHIELNVSYCFWLYSQNRAAHSSFLSYLFEWRRFSYWMRKKQHPMILMVCCRRNVYK